MNLVSSVLVIFFVQRIFGDEIISTDSGPLFRRNNMEPDIPYRQIYTMPEIPLQRNYTGPHVPFQRNYTGPHVPFQQNYPGPNIPFHQNYMGPNIPLHQNYMGPNIPLQRNYTGPHVPFQRNYTGPHVPFQQNYTGPNIPFRQNYPEQNIPFRQNYPGPNVPFHQNYTVPYIPFQQNDMQSNILRDHGHRHRRRRTTATPRVRSAVTFATLSVYRHLTDKPWIFEEIDYNFVFGRLYKQQHDCIGININCVMDRMFIRPICVANYYKKYNRYYGYTPKRLLSICEMDYRNCVYRQSYNRQVERNRKGVKRGVYGTTFYDDDLEITGEQQEDTCLSHDYGPYGRLD